MKTRLKEARRATGMNQSEAAKTLGVSLGTYRNWEQGRVIMNGEQLLRAASLFCTNVDFILMTDEAAYKDESSDTDELVSLYEAMDGKSRDTLLRIARELAEMFGRQTRDVCETEGPQ